MAVVKVPYAVRSGYFNSFGYSDRIVQEDKTLRRVIAVNGGVAYDIMTLPSGYELVGGADVNGDGISDILLHGNYTTVACLMSDIGPYEWRGLTYNETAVIVGGLSRNYWPGAALMVDETNNYAAVVNGDGSVSYLTGWDNSLTFKTTGDINGDGVTDILLTDTNGLIYVGYMTEYFTVGYWNNIQNIPAGYDLFSTVTNGFNDDLLLIDVNNSNPDEAYLIKWGIHNGAPVSWTVYDDDFLIDDDAIMVAPKKNPLVMADGFAYNIKNNLIIGVNSGYCTILADGEEVVAVGNFTGTGHETLLVQANDGTISTITGWDRRTMGNLGTYKACAAGDHNGDGRDDIIVYDKNANSYAAWVMGSYGPVDWKVIDYNANRIIAGVGEADGYAGDDFYMVDTVSNYIAISNQYGQYYVGGFDGSTYRVAGIGDFNNDKISDIAFASYDGSVYVWLMNNAYQVAGGMSINLEEPDKYVCGVLESSNGADLMLFDLEDGESCVAQLDHGYFSTVSEYDWYAPVYKKLTDVVAADFGKGAGLVSLDLDTNAIVMQRAGQYDEVCGYIYASDWSIAGGDTGKLLLEYSDGSAAFWHADGSMQWLGGPAEYDIVGYANVGGSAEKDIIMHNKATGEFAGWIMGGGTPVDWKWITSSAGADFEGCADYNGDGMDDLLISFDKSLYWIDSASRGVLTTAYMPNETELLDVADVNGDWHADLIIKHYSSNSEEDTGYLSYIDVFNNTMTDIMDLGHNQYRAAANIDGDNNYELLLHNPGNNYTLAVNV